MNKRQKKKLQRKQEQTNVNQKVKRKKVRSYTQSSKKRSYESALKSEENRKKANQKLSQKYKNQVTLTSWKFHELDSQGIKLKYLTTTNLRKVKKKDIVNNNINREKYPFLFDKNVFDFNKVYYFPDGKGLHIRFLDYSGENTIDELLQKFNNYSNESLIEFLTSIIIQSKTYNKKAENNGRGTSSGRAGTFRSSISTEKTAKMMTDIDNKKLQKSFENQSKKRYHTGTNKYWQTLSQDGGHIIKNMTGRECLVILNAIFYNVTEDSRDMYKGVYNNITRFIPEFKEILPIPK